MTKLKRKKLISIGIPCFNEELNVTQTYRELKRVTNKNKNYQYEFIFVDNGSADRTRELISEIARKDKNVIGVFLSRNFGPEASGQAAHDQASGDAFILFECDLQDPPDLILDFIKKWEEGFDIVIGVRNKIEDNFFMTFMRKSFYKIFKAISNIDVPVNAGGYSLINSKAMKALNSLPEKYRFGRGLRAWIGFKSTRIKYQRRKRERGKSSYNFLDYLHHAERSFFGFSYLPLDMIIYAGFILVVLAFIFIFVYLLLFILYGNPIKGSVTILVSIVFFGGIQLLAVSVLGKYIQVIVEETKARPTYIIEKIVNDKNKVSSW